MTDNFHSADCMTRRGSNWCTCGYIKPLSKLEQDNARLRAELEEAKRLLRLAIGVMSFEDLGKIPGIREWLKIDEVRE